MSVQPRVRRLAPSLSNSLVIVFKVDLSRTSASYLHRPLLSSVADLNSFKQVDSSVLFWKMVLGVRPIKLVLSSYCDVT